jgi:hypothetical protein
VVVLPSLREHETLIESSGAEVMAANQSLLGN